MVCLLLAACAAGTALGGMYWIRWRTDASVLAASKPAEWTGVVVEDPSAGMSGLRVAVRLDGGGDGATRGGVGALVSLRWPKDACEPAFGMRVVFKSRFAAVDPAKPGARDAERAGECANGSVWAVTSREWPGGPAASIARWRAQLGTRLGRIRGPGADLLVSTLLGDRRRIAGTPAEDALRAAGAGHLVAASGLHLGLACLLAAWVVRVAGADRRTQAMAALVVGSVFALATGLRVAVLRALLLVVAGWLAHLLGRRRDALAGLAAAAVVLVGLEPRAVFEVGLQLGVMAVASVVVFGPLAGRWLTAALPDGLRRVGDGLGSLLSLQLGTLPLAAGIFGMISTAGVVTLVAVVPLVQAALAGGVSGAVLATLWPAAADVLLGGACAATSMAVRVATAIAALPGAAFPVDALPVWAVVAWAAGMVVAWVRWPQPQRRWRVRLAAGFATACLMLVVLGPPLRPGSAIVVLDVGQGDSILVRDGEAAMLIDTGPDAKTMRRALARAGIRDLSCVVLTHAHADHTGGLKGLVGVARVGWIGGPDLSDAAPLKDARATADSLARDGWTPLHAGMEWQLGASHVRVLWPPAQASKDLETNDTSVILAVERDGCSALLLGDAEQRAQLGALEKGGAAATGPFQVMKAAHHGSVNGVLPQTLAKWRPSEALISVGGGNRFGHPHAAAMRVLADANVRAWRTDLQGDITVDTGAGGWRVSSARVAAATSLGEPGRRAVAPVSYATMDATRCTSARAAPGLFPDPRAERHGSQRPGGPQARLSHTRHRGALAGARGPPLA